MVSAFKQGASYTGCWYQEYCIIDTPNKNDKDNGKVYCRGYNYQNEDGGAVYVGQIVGPSSGTPYFQLNTLKEVKNQVKRDYGEYTYKRFPTGYETDSEGHVIGYTTSENPDDEIAYFPFSKAHDTSLVPGKTVVNGVNHYKDEITWTWCNVRQDNADADSWFYVGFEIPYLITDYSIHQTSGYDTNGNIVKDATTSTRVDDQTHPFYSHWDLGLPKGIKGDTLRNMRVITPTTATRVYDAASITIDSKTGEADISALREYAGKADDVSHSRKILVFDYYIYDKLLNPTPITIYLGDFNTITNITVADDGTLTITYTHNDNSVFTKKIRWITGVTLTTGNGSEGGHFRVTYNNGTAPYETDLTWVKGIEITENGSVVYTFAGAGDSETNHTTGIKTVANLLKWVDQVTLNEQTGIFKVTYNNGAPAFQTTLDWIKSIKLDEDGTLHFIHTKDNRDEQLTNELKWITDVELDPQNGKFTMNFNYGSPLVRQLDWIDDVYINEDTGLIQLHHTNPVIGTEDLAAKLKLITSASVSSTGVTTFYTNTGESFTLKNQGAQTDYHIKTVESVTLNTAISDDKHIHVKYNTDTSPIAIGDPINYVQDMVVRASDWHLLVLYNDPDHRAKAVDLDDENMATKVPTSAARYRFINGSGPWVNGVVNSQGTQYDSSIYWRDYGAIKDQSGILIGFNLTREEMGIGDNASLQDISNYLTQRFPNGLTGAQNQPGGIATKEKIITVDDAETDDKLFFAFDYNKYKWYYLGKIADGGMRDVKLVSKGGVTDNDRKTLNTKGLMFFSDSILTKTTGIPRYWDVNYVFTE